jgi:predicted component of type VI protein secretion system
VSISGKLYEAPLQLIDKQVTLLYHEDDPERIEVVWRGVTYGFLTPLDTHINSRIKRSRSKSTELVDSAEKGDEGSRPENSDLYKGGELFRRRESDGEL